MKVGLMSFIMPSRGSPPILLRWGPWGPPQAAPRTLAGLRIGAHQWRPLQEAAVCVVARR